VVDVVEHYADPELRPPPQVGRSIRRLLAHTPESYLQGLGKVVLTNSTDLPSSEKKRTRRRSMRGREKRVLGSYFQPWKGQPARIELYIDNVTLEEPQALLRIPLFCDLALAKVFFHELGHHLHATKRPERRAKEDVADDWSTRLSRQYFRKRYWYLRILMWPAAFLYRLAVRIRPDWRAT
jgi:hypothetical protein